MGDSSRVAINHEGVRSRLSNKKIKLKEKVNLAVNLSKGKFCFPNKEKLLLDWFLEVLDRKYTENKWKAAELSMFWQGFLAVLRQTTEGKPLQLDLDVLNNVVEQADTKNPHVAEAFDILLGLSSAQATEVANVLTLLDKLQDKDVSPVLEERMLHTLDKICRVHQLPAEHRLGSLLAKFSRRSGTETDKTLVNLLRVQMFRKAEDKFQELFVSMLGSESDKFNSVDQVGMFVDYINGGGDAVHLLSCLQSSATPSSTSTQLLRANLFLLALHLQGFTQVFSASSVILARVTVNAATPATATEPTVAAFKIRRIVEATLPVDATVLIGEEKMLKLLTGLARFCVESYGLTEDISCVLESLLQHHPLALEPLVGFLLAEYLRDRGAPCRVFQVVLDLMLKLRQLPKIVSKLLIYLRTQTKRDLAWRKEDLTLFGEAVSTVPRVQSIEMWKMLHYHITADCIPALGSSSASSSWRVTAPILSTVLCHAHLSDHNIPEPLSIRVRDLVQVTLTDVLDKLFECDMDADDKALYCNLVASLTDLTELITSYRGREFEAMAAFKIKYIEKLLDNKDFVNNSQLIIQSLRSNSGYNAKLWKSFRGQLLGDRDILKHIFHLIPQQYLPEATAAMSATALDFADGIAELADEAGMCALIIYAQFCSPQPSSCSKMLSPVAGAVELWTSSENWYSLQSQLGKLIQHSFQQIHDIKPGAALETFSPWSANLETLALLPVESLPKAQRLGLTLLCICHLFAGEIGKTVDEKLTELLARCFEDTDVFRFIDASDFLERVLDMSFLSSVFIETLASELAKYAKMLSEISENFARFQERIAKGDENSLTLFVSMLEHLTRPILDSGVAADKKATSTKLFNKVSKCIVRYGRKEALLSPTPLLLRSATVMVNLHCKAEGTEDLGKAEKFIRKVLDNSLALETAEVLELVNCLVEAEPGLSILSQDYKDTALRMALDNVDSEASSVFISQLLRDSDSGQIEKMFEGSQTPDNLVKLSKIILSAKISEQTRSTIKPFIEDLTVDIISNPKIGLTERIEFVGRIVSCSPSLISLNTESTALSSLLASSSLSYSTFKPFITFINKHPKAHVRAIPLLCLAVQRHLEFMEENPSSAESLALANAINTFFGTCKRHKMDWGNVVPYLIADLLHASISLATNLPVKQSLVTAAEALLDISSTHSHAYLSANMAQATNEMFKVVLQEYKAHKKFTGKNV